MPVKLNFLLKSKVFIIIEKKVCCLNNNEIDVEEILKRILQEESFVQNQILDYQEYLPEFILKTLEEIENIESHSIILEKNLNNSESINSLFRSFHNIKGSSGFVGQTVIQKIAHQTETLMDGCRKGSSVTNKKIIDLILNSSDYIKKLCNEKDLNENEAFLDEVSIHISKLESQENNNINQIIEGCFDVEDEVNLDFLDDFILEAKDHIDNLESTIIELEKNLNDTDLLHSIFRDLHSIKGLAGFAGQTFIQRISHQTETLIDGCRQGKLVTTHQIIDSIFQSLDFIKKICDDLAIIKNSNFLKEVYFHLQNMEKIENENINLEIIETEITNIEDEEEVDEEFLQDFVVEAKEHLENIESQVILLEKNPEDIEIIHSMFRSFHTIKGLAGFVNQNLVQEVAHQTETIMDNCRKGKIKVDKAIINLILTSSDYINKSCDDTSLTKNKAFITEINAHLKKLEDYETNNKISENKKIGEILVEHNVLEVHEVEEILVKQKEDYPDLKFGEIVLKETKVKSTEVINALKTQQSKQNKPEEYMRISASKVDSLVEMVGELIIAQSLIDQHANSRYAQDNFFIANLGRMTRITKDLQTVSMFLRMVALKSTFQKITRIARDTINELDKDIDFTISGEDTEIDRSVTEKLLDPLVHLVKNSISHGIESAEERILNGKSAQGNVKVAAYNKRGSIYIEISDDGNGINIERVYAKALEKGLIDPAIEYSEKEIQEFIMLPGFSTLEVANKISGRGIGMDVVKTEISKIGGKIEINSIKGKGSNFILKIPVNHAVLNGTIVDIEGSNYIIPTVNVKQIIQPKDDQWIFIQGLRSMIKVREDIMPLISVSKLFQTRKEEEEPVLVVIIEMDQKYKALPVRNVIGRQEIVVKPAGEEFSRLKYVSGMSILGDGKVSLILDIEHLYEKEGAQ